MNRTTRTLAVLSLIGAAAGLLGGVVAMPADPDLLTEMYP